ncbi:MAG: hypothetical protein Q8R69_20355 [Telluria sp.]|nr:hypothetical protein [Telluria sp.]
MPCSKRLLVLLILACCAQASALAADKQPCKRRSVQQVVESMPPAPPPPIQPARPALQGAPPLPAARLPVVPPGPVQINSCDAGGCTDINGQRYNGGVGNAGVDGQGRLCTRSGSTMQCF